MLAAGVTIGVVSTLFVEAFAAILTSVKLSVRTLDIIKAAGSTVVSGALATSINSVADTCYSGYNYRVEDIYAETIYGTDMCYDYYIKVTDKATGLTRYAHQGTYGTYTSDFQNLILSKIRQYYSGWY